MKLSEAKIPRAFISYSWDGEAHKQWVRELATKLRQDGVDVMLDQWGVAPGDQLPEFMERSLRENDFILIICTPQYKKRSEARLGGVGYEGHIMTAELYTIRNDRKFIPILRHTKWDAAAPSWLHGKYYIDLFRAERFEDSYQDLLNTLHGRRQQAPPIGRPADNNRDSLNKGLVSSLPQLASPVSNKKIARSGSIFPYRELNNWGFCNEQMKLVVTPKYDDAFPFFDGLALVKRKGLFGFISTEGEEVITPQYEEARSFSERLAAVKTRGKWGFVNVAGEMIIQPEYAMAGDFAEGCVEVTLDNYHWDFINKEGRKITGRTDGGYDKTQPFSEGLAYVNRFHPRGSVPFTDKYYIDKTGRELLAVHKYDAIGSFSEGLAYVAKKKFLLFTGLYGFINKKLEVVIPFQYQEAKGFSHGLASVKLANKWGFIDHEENKVIRFKYDDALSFSEGLAAVKLDKWGFINREGVEVISLDYDEVEAFRGGVARVKSKGKYGYVGSNGTQYFDG